MVMLASQVYLKTQKKKKKKQKNNSDFFLFFLSFIHLKQRSLYPGQDLKSKTKA
ncbi:hypothetical protein GLYMA_08G243400v4 [Glycine max]|uniref:Uncharacterized protein n=1 Tax=Glycine max TaxID=3847 RepID=K7L8L8_SOYBN|nr:hypothetical protein JHK86_022325 [Glycine max]KAH1052891.1 hypothetical protein GYH30_022260 [Glycine max]KRH44996.1 hypothetical protein GLYMA_08G243400v4 [Glycine max]